MPERAGGILDFKGRCGRTCCPSADSQQVPGSSPAHIGAAVGDKRKVFLRVEESLARQKGQSESNNEKPLLLNLLGNLFSGVISRQACVLPFDGGNKFYDIATLSSCFIRLGDCLFEIVMKYLLYRAIRISGDN